MERLVERAGNDLGSDGAGTLGLPERTAEIHPVERQDEVGLTHQFARFGRDRVGWLGVMGRVIAREHRPLFEVGKHAGADPFGELDPGLPVWLLA